MNFIELARFFQESPLMNYITLFFFVNMGITVFEVMLDLVTKKKRRWKDSGANMVIFILSQFLEKTIIGIVGIVALMPFHHLTPLSIPMNGWTWLLAILAADFTYYWMHRIEHEHRILWANHSVHHSSEDFNLTVAYRLSWVEPMIEWIFLVPMILIGFTPFQTLVAMIFVVQFQGWVHTERIGKLGWLDKIFNTPSVHRVHHGSNEKYLDKNYGGITMIWDHLFGTYQGEEEEVVYGLTNNIKTNNPFKINFIEYKRIWDDVKRCRNFKDAFRIVFGGLRWRPAYFQEHESEPGKK